MVEKLLIKMLLAALLLGMLGMAVAYLIFGKVSGQYIAPRAIFSMGGTRLENEDPAHFGIENVRYIIFASGVAGLLVGGFVPVMAFIMSRGN